MGVYGPYTAVAGAVQQCAVDQQADGLYFINKSVYDLYLAFTASQPPAVTSFGGGYWYYKVPTGDRRGVRVPQSVYAGAGFPGYVFVLPIDESGNLGLSGATSSNTLFNIETYEDASQMPPDYASAQFQNITTQNRMVSLPLGMLQWVTGQWTTSFTDLQTQSFAIPASLLAPAQPSINTYLYYALFSLADGTAAHVADTTLGAQYLHGGSGGTRLGSLFPLARFVIGSPQGGAVAAIEINPRNPILYQTKNGATPATADTIALYLHLSSGFVGLVFDYTIAASLDPLNGNAVAPIGMNQTQFAPTTSW